MKAGAALLAGALALGGCAAAAPPPPAVDLAALTCASEPLLGDAAPLAFDPQKAKATVSVLDGQARCMDDGRGRSLYRVFRLPHADAPYVLLLSAPPWGNTLLAPQLLFLDDAGKVKRRSSVTDFVFRGDTLSAALRSHPDEAYLVVASDPAALGQAVERIDQSVRGQMIATGTAFVNIYTGLDETKSLVLTPVGKFTIGTAPLQGQK